MTILMSFKILPLTDFWQELFQIESCQNRYSNALLKRSITKKYQICQCETIWLLQDGCCYHGNQKI